MCLLYALRYHVYLTRRAFDPLVEGDPFACLEDTNNLESYFGVGFLDGHRQYTLSLQYLSSSENDTNVIRAS
jgi:hypothetical protein